MKALPWIIAMCCAIVAICLGAALLVDASGARKAERRVRLLDQLRAQDAARLLPVPSLRTSQSYGAPYNVTIVCTVAGSSEGQDDDRVPLDPDGAPRPGDLYVKTCRATR